MGRDRLLEIVLTCASIYLGLVGLGMMFVPQHFGIGAVPSDPSPELLAFLRIFGGPCVGIAVLDWLTRKAEPSRLRNVIVLANIVGFGCVSAMDVWDVSMGHSRPAAKMFLVVHLSMTLAFVLVHAWTRKSA
jgi:hypothetical protein